MVWLVLVGWPGSVLAAGFLAPPQPLGCLFPHAAKSGAWAESSHTPRALLLTLGSLPSSFPATSRVAKVKLRWPGEMPSTPWTQTLATSASALAVITSALLQSDECKARCR